MRAVVLRSGELQVRDTSDPVPGPGQLLLRPLSAAICASDVHYMDHPNSAPRFVWDSGRDTIMGHELSVRSSATARTARATFRSAHASRACRC
jgi:threonine dehydrogenase-like Zn-dependent dehydrogenase